MTATSMIERPRTPAAAPKPFASAEIRKGRKEAAKTVRGAINRHVGQRIRSFRLTSGQTQVELGAALGLTNQQIQKYEKGVNAMSVERLWLTACSLGVSFEQLLDGVDAAALAALAPGETLSPDRLQNRRLRLEVADAMLRARSVGLLRSMLHLLRSLEEAEDAAPGPGNV
jgi:transcriptional regulator with XRE-family HTH domain